MSELSELKGEVKQLSLVTHKNAEDIVNMRTEYARWEGEMHQISIRLSNHSKQSQDNAKEATREIAEVKSDLSTFKKEITDIVNLRFSEFKEFMIVAKTGERQRTSLNNILLTVGSGIVVGVVVGVVIKLLEGV